MHKTTNYGSKPLAKGLIRDHQKHRIFLAAAPKFQHKLPALPGEWDLRAKCAPPEDQGSCGGCWAFSTTNSLRSFAMLSGKDPGALSKNYLLMNVGPVMEYGCGGGDFDAGLNMLNGMGPCLESLSPYQASDSVAYPAKAPVAATAPKWMAVGSGRPTAQELCEALWHHGKGGCLSVDIAADSTIENYHSGVIERTTSMGVNHMVRLVGYHAGASIDKGGHAVFDKHGNWLDPRGAYFIMRNNWAEDWGLQGDCLIAYGVNNLAETAMLFSE
jgi:C1A family cysteine protease